MPVVDSKITTERDQDLLNILIQKKVISESQKQQLINESKRKNITLAELLESSPAIKEEDLLKAKAQFYNLPFIDLYGRIVRADILNIVPQELAKNYQMVAFNKIGNELSVALVDPSNFKALEAIEFIARKNRYKIKYYLTSDGALKYIIRQYESLSAEVEEALKGTEEEAIRARKGVEISEEGFEEVVKAAPVSKMVSVILRHAIEGRASDVHIEPLTNETRVRYRIDGVLHTSLVLPKHVHSSIVARIKVLSNLKIDETRIPQDGRYRMEFEGREIDYRISTLPLINNEKVVMRILDTSTSIQELEQLGFEARTAEVMRANIQKSHGMFLITGPTGSGKSTTLYALMKILNNEAVNIVSLEDPVEYYIEGVSQSQVNPEVGLTFAAGLRSILRQDPDIIMVGEIRDNETAELAVHASLTGHIVLSTLHTNDAFGAIPRLIDMKIEPFLLASSVNVVMAQRLVRRICQHCREEITPPKSLEDEVISEIERVSEKFSPEEVKNLKRPLKLLKGRGCARCENTGYKGRIAIGEVLEMTDRLKSIITSPGDLTSAIKEEFKHQGFYTMKQDGIFKALKGVTTIEEVLEATRM